MKYPRLQWAKLTGCVLAVMLMCAPTQATEPSVDGDAVVTPEEHRRGAEQTFLTYPEWFLVHSPAEYAAFIKDHRPSEFPYLGHVRQFWQGYRAVYRETREKYPFNAGYHVMVMVIGVSTTVEYTIKSAYEVLIGRLTELLRGDGMTEEDEFAAKVAQDYVDFIRGTPWYEFDFSGRLKGLWSETSFWGPDPIRKWERKYALTTEYAVKAMYGWLIGKATKMGYEPPKPVTAIVVDPLPFGIRDRLPEIELLKALDEGRQLITVPRYAAFNIYVSGLAAEGVNIYEVAGNRSVILVSLLVPSDSGLESGDYDVMLEQPILTRPGEKRLVLKIPVAQLSRSLNEFRRQNFQIEHVYDF